MDIESLKEFKTTHLRRLNRRWAKTPLWISRLIILAVLAGIGLIVAKPAYSYFRKWLIERNFNAALEASAQHDSAKARELALAVIYAGDHRIAMLRVIEQAANDLGDPRYERFAGSLLSHPECTAADRLRVFQNLARNAPFGKLQAHWGHLTEADRTSQEFRLALVDRIVTDGAFNQGLKLLDDLPTDPPDPEVAARRIRCLIGQRTEKSLEIAQKRIVALWQIAPEHPADWCGLLETVPVEALDIFTLSPLRPWLTGGRPDHPGRGELMDARIHWLATKPAERDQWVTEVINRWRADGAEALCDFLVALNLPDRLVATFTDDVIAAKPDLIKARLEALIQLNQDAELAATLTQHGASLEPIDQAAFAAVAAHRINDGSNLNLNWNKALAEGVTSQQPDALLKLHGFAQRARMLPEAERALVAAIKAARGPLPPYEALSSALDGLTRKGLEHDLMAILNEYLKLEPWNPLVVSRHAHLTALLGLEKPADVIKRLTELAEKYPTETQIIAVLATVQVLADQPNEAVETWKRLAVAPEDLTLGYRVAYLSTAVLSGQLDRADPSVKDFPWENLMPSERTRFSKLIRPEEPPPAAAPAQRPEPAPEATKDPTPEAKPEPSIIETIGGE
jgi:hypothetical protein